MEQGIQSQPVLTFLSGGIHGGIANYVQVATHDYVSLSQVITLLKEASEKVELSRIWAVDIDQSVGGVGDGVNKK